MEDDKLQRLHDTLSMLRPKGKTGGLGRGSLGIMKKDDDGLPKNALYSRFVRAGAGDNHHIKFEDSAGEKDKKASKKSKKEKKIKEKDANTIDDSTIEKKKNKKRKLDDTQASKSSKADIDWAATIKTVLKEGDNSMDIKDLRKSVLKKLKGELDEDMSKADKKSLFDSELMKVKKVSVKDSIATYEKKKR